MTRHRPFNQPPRSPPGPPAGFSLIALDFCRPDLLQKPVLAPQLVVPGHLVQALPPRVPIPLPISAQLGTLDTACPPEVRPLLVAGVDYPPMQAHPVFAPGLPRSMYLNAAALGEKRKRKEKNERLSR
jgi:hypothetical protein